MLVSSALTFNMCNMIVFIMFKLMHGRPVHGITSSSIQRIPLNLKTDVVFAG